MIDPELYIKEGLKIVDSLISQGNLQAALNGCHELLKVNPYHKKLQKYLSKIEKLILENNSKKVDADISATMHLWKEGRFDELLNIYIRLYQFAPGHEKLRELLENLYSKLSDQKKDERSDFIRRALDAMSQLLREKRFGDTIQACNELLSIDPINNEVKEYFKKAKDSLIKEKLEQNAKVVDGSDFERALELYNTLLAIDPDNQRVKQLAFQAKAQIAQEKALSGKIHLNESIARMKELFKNTEYEKVIQLCEEIDRLDPGNFTAKFFKQKAKRAIRHESNFLIVKFMKEAWAKLASEYQKNPTAFVRI